MSKRPAGALITVLADDTGGVAGRRTQLLRAVLERIRSGALAPGTRLPSARQLARDWRVARGVVDEVFAQLQDEGWIQRRVGDGSYVATTLPAPPSPPATATPERGPNDAARRVLSHFAPVMAQARRFELPRQQFHPPVLHPRAWPVHDFPLDRWRRLVAAALSEDWRDHLGYGPAEGLPVLRDAIARHLALTRSIRCGAEQVIVVNSPAQALEIVTRVLLQPGDRVWVEDPGHPSLPLLLEMLHVQAVGVPLDDEGFDLAQGRRRAPDAVLAYLHPLTQYPLGVPTSAARGDALLQWAERRHGWIVEGCFNDELVHRGPTPPALHARDRADRVLLMGTLEGVLFPALRIAYLVVPPRLVDVFVAARGLLGDHTQTTGQLALAGFIDGGHLTAHLRRLQERVGARRDALRQAVRRWLPAAAILSRTDSGLHACLHLPPEWPDHEVVQTLRRRGVGGEALSSRCWQATGLNGLIVGYGADEPERIDAAVRVIGEVLEGMAVAEDADGA